LLHEILAVTTSVADGIDKGIRIEIGFVNLGDLLATSSIALGIIRN
jgi:hypothetical protein